MKIHNFQTVSPIWVPFSAVFLTLKILSYKIRKILFYENYFKKSRIPDFCKLWYFENDVELFVNCSDLVNENWYLCVVPAIHYDWDVIMWYIGFGIIWNYVVIIFVDLMLTFRLCGLLLCAYLVYMQWCIHDNWLYQVLVDEVHVYAVWCVYDK